MPLNFIYSRLVEMRNALYDKGVFKSHDLGARTISIGNITTGGTGKTPLVILVAQTLAARGKRVCILTRGYGRKNPKKRVLVSNGREILANARTGGDEPVEMAVGLGGRAIIIADADRVAAANWARDEFGVNVFVLDDAFQHRQAKRDLDIVCIDGSNPFGGGRTLPSGRLREPLKNLSRAGVVVITRADMVANIDEIRSRIFEYLPDRPIFTASTHMRQMTLLEKFLTPLMPGESVETDFDYRTLANSKALAFCGLGSPEAFFNRLRRDNFVLAGTVALADHHYYSAKDALRIVATAKEAGAEYLLTTGKDAVKLAGIEIDLPCFVLETETVIDNADQFAALL